MISSRLFPPASGHTPCGAHVGGYHRVRVRNAVVLAFLAAQLLRELAELLLLRFIFF